MYLGDKGGFPHEGIAYAECEKAPAVATDHLGTSNLYRLYQKQSCRKVGNAYLVDYTSSSQYEVWIMTGQCDLHATSPLTKPDAGKWSFPVACATRPSLVKSLGLATGSIECADGCEYNHVKNGDGTSTGTPTGNVCSVPAVDLGKSNSCCDKTTGPVGVGNPINMFVGNKVEVVPDYVDPKGHLDFTRYYSSASVSFNQGTVLGPQWHHSYQLAVVPSAPNSDRRLNRATGDSYNFRLTGSLWAPDQDVSERLVSVMSGANIVGWRATRLDNVIEVFNASGQLTQIEYPDGDIVQATYDQGKLSRLTDRQGRYIALVYVNGLLDSVTMPDGRAITYAYGTSQQLTTVSYKANNASAPYALRQYRYTIPNDSKLLTSVIDESGQQYATWEYDALGRATSSYHGASADRVSVAYGIGRSWVSTPLGQTVEMDYQLQFGRAKVASAQQLCANCGGQAYQGRTYDANGYLDEQTDFAGIVTNQDYNSRGLLTQEIDSKNVSGTKRTIQTDWHATFNLPTERRIYDAAGTLVRKEVWTYNSHGQVLTHSVSDL